MTAAEDLVLVVDGSFLQRDLTWDEVVFVDTTFNLARDRGTRRDADMFGGAEAAGHAFDARYHAACRRYLAEVNPLADTPPSPGSNATSDTASPAHTPDTPTTPAQPPPPTSKQASKKSVMG